MNHRTEPRTGNARTMRAQTTVPPEVCVLLRAMLTSAAMKTTAFRIRKIPMMPQDGISCSTADADSFIVISPEIVRLLMPNHIFSVRRDQRLPEVSRVLHDLRSGPRHVSPSEMRREHFPHRMRPINTGREGQRISTDIEIRVAQIFPADESRATFGQIEAMGILIATIGGWHFVLRELLIRF